MWRYFVDAFKIYSQLTLNKGDCPQQHKWTTFKQLNVLRAKTGFSEKKKFFRQVCNSNPAQIVSLLTCPMDFKFKNAISTLAWVSSLQAFSIDFVPASPHINVRADSLKLIYISISYWFCFYGESWLSQILVLGSVLEE